MLLCCPPDPRGSEGFHRYTLLIPVVGIVREPFVYEAVCITTAPSLNGPLQPDPAVPVCRPWTAVAGVKACNNPAPWVHPNGTIYLWCGGKLLRADGIAGPYTRVGNQTMSGKGVAGHLEDPQIWTDKRGHWHCLFHVFQSATGWLASTQKNEY